MYLVLNIYRQNFQHTERDRFFHVSSWLKFYIYPGCFFIHYLLFHLHNNNKIEQKWEAARTEREKGDNLFIFIPKNYYKIS